MNNSKVIFTCIDESYLNPAIVWLSSLKNNVLDLSEEKVDVIIYHLGDIDKTNLEAVGVEDLSFVEITTPSTEASPPFDLKTTEAMTLRIAALDLLLESEYQTAYYFDTDTTFVSGADAILDITPSHEVALLAVPDHVFPEKEEIYQKRARDWNRRKTITSNYFNSGVMVIDLPAAKQLLEVSEHTSLTEAYGKTESEMVFPDQDFLNIFFNNHGNLDRTFNAFADFAVVTTLNATPLLDEVWFISQAAIIHWLSNTKPWVPNSHNELVSAIMPYHLYVNETMKVSSLLSPDFIKAVMAKYTNNRMAETAINDRARSSDIEIASRLFSNCI